MPFNGGSCSVYGSQMLCFGDAADQQAAQYYTNIGYNWTNATWFEGSAYPVQLAYASCSTAGNYTYCVGTGGELAYANTVYYGELQYNPYFGSSGVAAWQPTTPYPTPFAFDPCSIYKGYIYCVGEYPYTQLEADNGITPAYYANVSASGVGAWKETTSYPATLFEGTCDTYNGYIYCIGNYNLGALSTLHSPAYYAPVSANGIGAWQQTTSYPTVLVNAGCAISNVTNDIYCVGTQFGDAAQQESAYYAPVAANGIGAWQQTTSYPVPLYGTSCEIPGAGGGYLTGGGEQ